MPISAPGISDAFIVSVMAVSSLAAVDFSRDWFGRDVGDSAGDDEEDEEGDRAGDSVADPLADSVGAAEQPPATTVAHTIAASAARLVTMALAPPSPAAPRSVLLWV